MAGYPGSGGVWLNPGMLAGVDLSKAEIQYRPGGGIASIRVPKEPTPTSSTQTQTSQSQTSQSQTSQSQASQAESNSASWSGASQAQAAQREAWRDTALRRLESVAGGHALPYDPQAVQRMQAAAADQAGQAAAQQAAQMRAQAASAGVGAQDPAMRDAMREAAARRLDQVQQASRDIDMRATEANFSAQQQAASTLGGMQFASGTRGSTQQDARGSTQATQTAQTDTRSSTQTMRYDAPPSAPPLDMPPTLRRRRRVTGYTPTAMGFIPGNAWGAQQTRRWRQGY